MCAAFIVYTPKANLLTYCSSQPELHSFFNAIGVQNATGNILNDLNLPVNPNIPSGFDDSMLLRTARGDREQEDPIDIIKVITKDNTTSTYAEYLDEFNWKSLPSETLEDLVYNKGKQNAFCANAVLQVRI